MSCGMTCEMLSEYVRLYVHDAYVHAIMYEDMMFMKCIFVWESKSLTGAGTLNAGLLVEEHSALLSPLGARVGRIPVGEDNSVRE